MARQPSFDACFNDWKRFCFVLREIANGKGGRPFSGFEAQSRAREVLSECGYSWFAGTPQRDAYAAELAQQSSILHMISGLMRERKHGEPQSDDYARSLRLRR
jgi:hypothetical protein